MQQDKDLQGVHVGFDSYTFRPVGRHPAMVIFAVACGRVADLAAPHPEHYMVGRPCSACRFPARSHIPSFASPPSIQLCDDLLLRNQPICANLFRSEPFSSNASSPEATFLPRSREVFRPLDQPLSRSYTFGSPSPRHLVARASSYLPQTLSVSSFHLAKSEKVGSVVRPTLRGTILHDIQHLDGIQYFP